MVETIEQLLENDLTEVAPRIQRHTARAGSESKSKDDELADEVSNIERDKRLSPSESRSQIKEAIARRYTGPA